MQNEKHEDSVRAIAAYLAGLTGPTLLLPVPVTHEQVARTVLAIHERVQAEAAAQEQRDFYAATRTDL